MVVKFCCLICCNASTCSVLTKHGLETATAAERTEHHNSTSALTDGLLLRVRSLAENCSSAETMRPGHDTSTARTAGDRRA